MKQDLCTAEGQAQHYGLPLGAVVVGHAGINSRTDPTVAESLMLRLQANAESAPSRGNGNPDPRFASFTFEELERFAAAQHKIVDRIKADAGGGQLSERQEVRLEEAQECIAYAEAEMERRPEMQQSRAQFEANAAANSSPGRKTSADPMPRSIAPGGPEASAAEASRTGAVFANGTKNFSAKLFAAPRSDDRAIKPEEFFNALATHTFDPRLISNATGTTGIGVDGGFDVPTIWYRGMIDQALQTSEFAQRCRIFPADSNSLVIPMLDISNRSAGVAGLIAHWAGENQAQAAQAMKWKAVEMKLKKTFVLSEASSELVEDGINYVEQLTSGMSLATAQTLDAGILYGTGVGMPLGIVNSPGAIQIDAESGQVADTVVWGNLVNMYSRLAPAAQKRATWFVSPQVLPSLMAVKVPGTDAPALLSGGFNDAAAGTPAMSIFGRPVVVTEIAGQVGDVGDIVFADMSQYGLLMKRSARMENSNAPGFARDVISFRMILRVDGTPLWPTPITPYNGGTTLTWATYLAPRA